MNINLVVLFLGLSLCAHVTLTFNIPLRTYHQNHINNYRNNYHNRHRFDSKPSSSNTPTDDELNTLSDLLKLAAEDDDDDLTPISNNDDDDDQQQQQEDSLELPSSLLNNDDDDSTVIVSQQKPPLVDEYFAELNRQSSPQPVAILPQNTVAAAVDEEELESHSSLVAGHGHQYVSGGAGEGKQHLQPDGSVDNKEEIKSDEDLPAYCDPPNPCPIGVVSDDCDPSPYEVFSAQFSREYQEQQNCMCDDDHNECHKRSKSTSTSTQNEKVSDFIANLNVIRIKMTLFLFW
jgi:hypothetical protein